jgi:hypothetical protein
MRVDLLAVNTTDNSIPINFTQIGTLTSPVQGGSVCILGFSIPNAYTEIMRWPSDTKYQITMTYKTFSFSQYLIFEDRGSGRIIYEIEHLVSIINTAIVNCTAGLSALCTAGGDTYPTVDTPYFTYDVNTSLYSVHAVCSTGSSYAYFNESATNAISIYLNNRFFYVIQSLPVMHYPYNPSSKEWKLKFTRSGAETVATTLYNRTQEATSISSYATPRMMYITTSLPIESECICTTNSNSGQINENILQTYSLPYVNGVKNLQENNDFSAPADPYRVSLMTNSPIYEVRCNVLYQDNDGTKHQFYLQPGSSAWILLDIRK